MHANPLRHPAPCPACGRILSLDGTPAKCHGCGQPAPATLAVEALLIGAGWTRLNAFNTGVIAWFLPGSDAMAQVDSVLHIYRDWFVPAVRFELTDLPAIRAALDSLTPKQEVR